MKRIEAFEHHYDLYLDNLLKTVKKKGILVKTMEKGTSFVCEIREQYKKELGAVYVKNIFGNITNIYMRYMKIMMVLSNTMIILSYPKEI